MTNKKVNKNDPHWAIIGHFNWTLIANKINQKYFNDTTDFQIIQLNSRHWHFFPVFEGKFKLCDTFNLS